RAFCRLQHAEQHLHQGGFAGAILAEQGVDFAAGNGEINAIAGLESVEILAQAAHIKQRPSGNIRRHYIPSACCAWPRRRWLLASAPIQLIERQATVCRSASQASMQPLAWRRCRQCKRGTMTAALIL